MENDTELSIHEIVTKANGSMLSKVVAVPRKAGLVRSLQNKSAMRRCIEFDEDTTTSQGEDSAVIEVRQVHAAKYIAISCPWQLADQYDVTGRYKFVPEDTPGVRMPQNIVLDRVRRFRACNALYRNTPVWLDKLCINQDDSDEKIVAVNSMDLVYHYCSCTLGLLFTPLDSIAQVGMLKSLLENEFAELEGNDAVLRISLSEADPILDLIELILKDAFWHRAWIFQEDFLASRNMKLLIPCALDLTGMFPEGGHVDFGKTNGEIEVSSVNFRFATTILCLALNKRGNWAIKERCSKILRSARWYTCLYKSRTMGIRYASIRAMAPAIFDDICSRAISVQTDVLAIASNCCRYTQRLNAQVLETEKIQLSLAILTLCLLNGEILRHGIAIKEVIGKSFFDCLQREMLPVEPPVESSELIFIKYARYSRPRLSMNGMIVWGVLSRADRKFFVRVSDAAKEEYWQTYDPKDTAQLNNVEISLLTALAKYLLSHNITALSHLITMFLDDQLSGQTGYQQYWSAKHYKIMMAKSVCRAMAQGRPLIMARPFQHDKWHPYAGVFVPHDPDNDVVATYGFTSVEPDHEFKDGDILARKNWRWTSLEVAHNPDPTSRTKITPIRWMNGLCFFNEMYRRDWFVPWPEWMRYSG